MIWRGRSEDPDGVDAPGIDNGDVEQPAPIPPAQDARESVGRRIDSVLEAAEQAAAGIREDAQEWARRYMEYSRHKADEVAAQRVRELSQLTESLVTRAHAVARQSDELMRAIGQAGQQASGNHAQPEAPRARQRPPQAGAAPANGPPPRQQPRPQTPAPTPAQAPAPQPAPAPPAVSETRIKSSISDGARLLVTQMTVAGSSREEIAQRLRDEVGVVDPDAVLDELGL